MTGAFQLKPPSNPGGGDLGNFQTGIVKIRHCTHPRVQSIRKGERHVEEIPRELSIDVYISKSAKESIKEVNQGRNPGDT